MKRSEAMRIALEWAKIPIDPKSEMVTVPRGLLQDMIRLLKDVRDGVPFEDDEDD